MQFLRIFKPFFSTCRLEGTPQNGAADERESNLLLTFIVGSVSGGDARCGVIASDPRGAAVPVCDKRMMQAT